jgi:hypothetical protein
VFSHILLLTSRQLMEITAGNMLASVKVGETVIFNYGTGIRLRRVHVSTVSNLDVNLILMCRPVIANLQADTGAFQIKVNQNAGEFTSYLFSALGR